MNNLILTISNNYNFFHLSRFFLSLFATSFRGRAVLYAGPNTKSITVKKLQAIGVEVIRYQNEFPFISQPHPDNFAVLPSPIHIYNFRHFLYYDYVLKHEAEYANVLLCDVRDIVFQKDPFAFPISQALYVAMESRARLMGSCPYNTAWIKSGYGDEILEEMAPHVISCAGTTLGPVGIIKNYLHTLLTEITQVRDAYNCADQAMHNRLLQLNRLGPVVRMYNDNTPVLTMGAESTYTLTKNGRILDGSGNLPGIVHQYDRHATLLDAIDGWVFKNPLHKYYLKTFYKLLG